MYDADVHRHSIKPYKHVLLALYATVSFYNSQVKKRLPFLHSSGLMTAYFIGNIRIFPEIYAMVTFSMYLRSILLCRFFLYE